MLIVDDSFANRGRCCTDAVGSEAFGGDNVHGFRLGGCCDGLTFVRGERDQAGKGSTGDRNRRPVDLTCVWVEGRGRERWDKQIESLHALLGHVH